MTSLLFIYIALCIYGIFFTDRLIFLPQPSSYQDTPEILKLAVTEQIKISAIHLVNPAATHTILYSHGNAEDLGDNRDRFERFRNLGFSVFAYDYQGYGTSDGYPTERNAYRDINTAYAYLVETLKVLPTRILVYGRSLGSGPSVDLAVRQSVGGLILESPFLSTFRVVTRIPIFPFDKFANVNKIHRVRVPVLIIHGTEDEVIPFWHGQQLFAKANEPKRFVAIMGAQHNDVVEVAGSQYDEILQTFQPLHSDN